MEDRMKKFLSILVLVLLCIYLIADEFEKTEQPRFTEEQMDAKAAQFKAETGFQGQIEYNLEKGVFMKIIGEFPNISVHDTISARSATLSICDMLLPYLKAEREQLKIVRNYQDIMGFIVSLDQEINGYAIEPHAGMTIDFRKKNFSFIEVKSSIIPNLNVQTDNLLSRSEAEGIFNKELENKLAQILNAEILITRYWSEDTQDKSQPEYYKPCWVIYYRINVEHFAMYIDATSGKVLRIMKEIPFDYLNLYTKGEVYARDSYSQPTDSYVPFSNIK